MRVVSCGVTDLYQGGEGCWWTPVSRHLGMRTLDYVNGGVVSYLSNKWNCWGVREQPKEKL